MTGTGIPDALRMRRLNVQIILVAPIFNIVSSPSSHGTPFGAENDRECNSHRYDHFRVTSLKLKPPAFNWLNTESYRGDSPIYKIRVGVIAAQEPLKLLVRMQFLYAGPFY